ncbi:MAG: hypothetical protein P1U86_21670 [Verrucomicrobiales bacterium]|nr:hypothetical protein [Verrucomicrobiales bacterium]MEC5125169.1 hypothetical protein [Verrucomicrobiales bacterium BCK34]
MKLALQFPLLGIILVIFNAIILNDPMALRADASPLFSLALPSGAEWLPGASDLLIIGGVVLLYLELFKATRTSVGAIVEHILSLVVFLIFLIEFIVFAPAANSTCVILMLLALLDVIGGFTISISTARRDMSFG